MWRYKTVLLWFLLLSFPCLGQTVEPHPKLLLRTIKQTYGRGERIAIEYRIQNAGSKPFYMNPKVEQVGGMDAGVRLTVYDGMGRKVVGQVVGENFIPDYKHIQDLPLYIRERWLLMTPDTFCGELTYYPVFPELKPGPYTLIATYFSNILEVVTKEQANSLASLPYPVLSGTVESNKVSFVVRK